MNPFEPPSGPEPAPPARSVLRVAGGIAMGCGFLMITVAALLVGSAYATRCPPDDIACGEAAVYSVLAAGSLVFIGGLVAAIGWLLYRRRPKR